MLLHPMSFPYKLDHILSILKKYQVLPVTLSALIKGWKSAAWK